MMRRFLDWLMFWKKPKKPAGFSPEEAKAFDDLLKSFEDGIALWKSRDSCIPDSAKATWKSSGLAK